MEESNSNAGFSARARAYFAKAFGADNLRVQATQILGGISRQTWRVDAAWETVEGKPAERSLILRLDPPSSLLESGRRVEYAMYKAFWGVPGVPVPEPVLIEDDPEPLGMAFFATARLDGVAHQSAFLGPEFKEAGPKIACETFEILGAIAATDYAGLGLEGVLPVPSEDKAWEPQLDYWEKTFHDHALGPLPITEAAIRRLRREPPPPVPKVTVVHGDYHFGNWLYSPEGVIAVLDWEMAHLGDPHEDLAWAFLKNWRSGSQPNKIMEYLEPEEAIRIWESARGLEVNYEAFRWWTLFSHVKANAIYMKAAYEAATSSHAPLIYTFVSWSMIDKQELGMLEEMGVSS